MPLFQYWVEPMKRIIFLWKCRTTYPSCHTVTSQRACCLSNQREKGSGFSVIPFKGNWLLVGLTEQSAPVLEAKSSFSSLTVFCIQATSEKIGQRRLGLFWESYPVQTYPEGMYSSTYSFGILLQFILAIKSIRGDTSHAWSSFKHTLLQKKNSSCFLLAVPFFLLHTPSPYTHNLHKRIKTF